MTKKDYLKISRMLIETFELSLEVGKHRHKIIQIFSKHLKLDNPKFDPERFLEDINQLSQR